MFAPVEANLSRSRIMKLIAEGAVSMQGARVTDPKAKVAMGQVWQIALPPVRDLETVAQNIALDVVYEDDALIVVNKPAGMVVHPAPGSPDGTLVNALLHHCADSLSGIGGAKRPGIVHRIDKDTSGLLVVAKTDQAHHHLAAQFAKHSVERKYLALVYGVPDAADPRLTGLPGVGFEASNILRITTHLARHKTDRQRQAVVKTGGRHAITRARVLERLGTPPCLSLVECWLETGRTHQIRVHMSYAGHGLIGDLVYGRARKLPRDAFRDNVLVSLTNFPRQALHATSLGFTHPKNEEKMHFNSSLPNDLKALLSTLKS